MDGTTASAAGPFPDPHWRLWISVDAYTPVEAGTETDFLKPKYFLTCTSTKYFGAAVQIFAQVGFPSPTDLSNWLKYRFPPTSAYLIPSWAFGWNSRLGFFVAVQFTPKALTLFAFHMAASRRLTFELSGRQRQDARPGLAKMYRVPPDRAWWPAVGAALERGVRPHWCPREAALRARGAMTLPLLAGRIVRRLTGAGLFPWPCPLPAHRRVCPATGSSS